MSLPKPSHASFAPNALLARAAESGSPDDLRLALDAGADLSAARLALPIAFALARGGHAAALGLAIERGAVVRGLDPDGQSLAHRCCASGSSACLALALAAGAEAALACDGAAPIRLAAFGAHPRLLRMLLQAMTPAERELHMPLALMGAAQVGAPECAQILLDFGADPNDEGTIHAHGSTPLTEACSLGHPRVAAVLLAAGAHPDGLGPRPSGQRVGPLSWAASNGAGAASVLPLPLSGEDAEPDCLEPRQVKVENGRFLECARLLIEAGASVDAPDFCGSTPLTHAAKLGNVQALLLLAQAGADLTARDAQGLDARDHARRRGHVQCADLIDSCIQQRELAASVDSPPAHRSPARRV